MRTCRLASAAFLVLFPTTTIRAESPPAPVTLEDAVRQAVAARKLDDSDNFEPSAASKLPFREVAKDGGVLVGFETGMSTAFGNEIPYSIRPVYRANGKEWVGAPVGNFSSYKVRRTVRTVAKDGYAVGGIWQRTGTWIDKFALLYMRVKDGHLDRTDHYTSEWVGSSDGGTERYTDGRGRPVAGVFADGNREQARGIGLIYARVPVPQPPPKATEPDPAAVEKADKGNGGTDNGTGESKRSKLQDEADARKGQRTASDDGLNPIWIVVIAGAVMLPMILMAVVVMRRNDDVRRPGRNEGALLPELRRRPLREGQSPGEDQPEGEPLAERPGLAARLAPYTNVPPPAADPVTAAAEQPPFFVVRATYRARFNRMTRIYVLPDELLVIDAGPGSDFNDTAGVSAAVLSGGGAIGALIGGMVGKAVADSQKESGESLQRGLDRLDLAALQEWASSERGNFRARLGDLLGVEIDPPSRATMFRAKGPALAKFRFRHRSLGEFTFDILTGVELRGAVVTLQSALGDRLRIGSGWDEAMAPFLGRM